MIAANRKRWFEHFLAWHLKRRFKKRFSAVRIRGLEALAEMTARGPVILASNHTAWWDSLLVFYTSFALLRLKGFALMDARNLRKIPLLGWIGAFGVEIGDKEDGKRVVEYAASVMNAPKVILLTYPQGAERPVMLPLEFKPGTARIAHAAPHALLVPTAVRYDHGKHELPEALLSFGPPVPLGATPEETNMRLQAAVAVLMSENVASVCGVKS